MSQEKNDIEWFINELHKKKRYHTQICSWSLKEPLMTRACTCHLIEYYKLLGRIEKFFIEYGTGIFDER